MKILAIETSCDETAIAIVDAEGDEKSARFRVLGDALLSQVEIHKAYGGVFPALAKREHAKNIVPLLEAALEEAELLREDAQALSGKTRAAVVALLAREPGLEEQFLEFVGECEPPAIDAIAVTEGPGLEPALWVGINFAKALGLAWNKPLVAVDHMEGHIFAALAREAPAEGHLLQEEGALLQIGDAEMPVLALLVSGGHTELVLMKEWLRYELVGRTRDDAVGEAFDKVARMLGLPYPGGPEISKLAEAARAAGQASPFTLPRPMLDSPSCDFSFAGLKTAVLYLLKERTGVGGAEKRHIAHEFENAVADVLWKKTARALAETGARTLVIGGGVSANAHLRRVFTEKMKEEYPDAALHIPAPALTTDNAVMIALAGYYRALRKDYARDIIARGNRALAERR